MHPMSIAVLAITILTALPAMATDHGNALMTMTGEGIQLFERDHAFAGSIAGAPVYAALEQEPVGGRVFVRHGGETLIVNFDVDHGLYGGTLSEKDADGATVDTAIAFVKAEMVGDTGASLVLAIDGERVPVSLVGARIEHGHFQAPRFSAEMGGRTVAFEFSGRACFGYSANIAMMVFGTYAHLQKFLN